jgi:endonuclease/exonuclease/phosphatase family metal-dependent hydrolase/2'-5' RNA ligase/uncharacterized protein (UPF0248 family)
MKEKEKEKLADSHAIYSRILWDDALDKQHFWIGFTDRMSASGIREKYLLDWNPEGDIPWHRVVYIRCKEIKVWDRKNRVDLFKEQNLPTFAWLQTDNIFVPLVISNGEAQYNFTNRPCYAFVQNAWSELEKSLANMERGWGEVSELKIWTWNILKDTHSPELTYNTTRLPAILAQIKESNADIIALQEVSKMFWRELLAQDWARKYYVSDLPTSDIFTQDSVVILAKMPFIVTEHIFSVHKRLLIARLQVQDAPLHVTTVHLTSDMSANSNEKRAQQLQVFFDWANAVQGDAIVLGDFNANSDEQARLFAGKGFVDAWLQLHPEDDGYTYYPQKNVLASLLSPSQQARRLDAMHVRSTVWRAVQASLQATAPIVSPFGGKGENDVMYCSDHFALCATIAYQTHPNPVGKTFATAKPSYQQGIVWIPPQHLWRNIQELRAVYDSKFARWMPHITLIYGFISEELFAEATPIIASALADMPPFELVLESIQYFEHTKTITAWLQPDAEATRQLQALQARLQTLFPTCDEQSTKENGFTPHMSIGQFESVEQARKALPTWKPLKTTVQEIALISRGKDTPFEVKYTVSLGNNTFAQAVPAWQKGIATYMPTSTWQQQQDREVVLGIIRQACEEAIPQTVQVELMGSAYLGITTPTSDIDVVCIIPKEVERVFFLHNLREVLGVFATSMRLAEDAQVPVLKLVINEVAIDILVAQSPIFPVVFALPALLRQQNQFDALSWQIIAGILEAETILKTAQEATDLETFRQYTKAVKAWAKARSLVGNGWGYLGSYSWTVLATHALLAYTKQTNLPTLEDFLRFFFKMYAQWDWKNPVSLTRVGSAYKVSSRRDKLPIITSIEPCFNSAKNVTRSTAKRLKAEWNRAHQITKKPATEAVWEQLYEPVQKIGESFLNVSLILRTTLSPTLAQATGWLEGNIISLWLDLEQDENSTILCLPALAYQGEQAIFTFGIEGEIDQAHLEACLRAFVGKFGEANIEEVLLSWEF